MGYLILNLIFYVIQFDGFRNVLITTQIMNTWSPIRYNSWNYNHLPSCWVSRTPPNTYCESHRIEPICRSSLDMPRPVKSPPMAKIKNIFYKYIISQKMQWTSHWFHTDLQISQSEVNAGNGFKFLQFCSRWGNICTYSAYKFGVHWAILSTPYII